jgi:hypothetical protein
MEGNTGSGTVPVGAGGEVAYTFAGRISGVGSTILPYQPIDSTDDDPRTMLLVRRAFPTSSDPRTTGYSSPVRIVDVTSKAQSCFALMQSDRWNNSYAWHRVSAVTALAASDYNDAKYQPRVKVTPTLSGGFPSYDSTVNMIVCDRVSEFIVEAYIKSATGSSWQKVPTTTTYRDDAIWCGNTRGTGSYFGYSFMPKLIRVTVTVHPYNDQKPLRQEPYAGEIPTALPKKYRGMVFRQVFSLNGRLNTK